MGYDYNECLFIIGSAVDRDMSASFVWGEIQAGYSDGEFAGSGYDYDAGN